MGRLLDLIIFIVVVAVLWWALSSVLAALNVPSPFDTLAVVLFVVLAVLAGVDYLRGGAWFWTRR